MQYVTYKYQYLIPNNVVIKYSNGWRWDIYEMESYEDKNNQGSEFIGVFNLF